MAAQFPQESAWKGVVRKHQLTDNGLQKALAAYEKLGEDKPVERIKALDAAKKLAASLAKVKEVAANAEASKFLDQLEVSAESTKKLVAAEAAKAEAQGDSEAKLDLSKLRALIEAIGKVLAVSKSEREGPDAAKDGAILQCLPEIGQVVITGGTAAVLLAKLKVEVAAIVLTRGQAMRALVPKLILTVGGLSVAMGAHLIAIHRAAECYRRHNNPAQRVLEAREAQTRTLRVHLDREKERLAR